MNWESRVLEVLAASLMRPVVLMAAAMVVLRCFRVEHPASRHAVWSVVLAGILLLPFAAVVVPPVELAVLPQGPLFSLIRSAALDEERPAVNHAREEPSTVASGLRTPGTSVEPAGHSPETPAASVAAQQGWRWQLVSVRTILIWGYVSGLVVILAYRAMGWLLLWRVRSRSTAQTRQWLRESPDVLVPIAVGMLRPTVLLPAGWRTWPADARRAALLHEFAHIRRRDAWVQGLSRLVRCVFWYHPLVWWVSRRVSECAEMACDAAVLQRGVDPFRYSRVLLEFSDVVRRNGYRATLPGLAITGRSWLSRRIDHVIALSCRKPRRLSRPLATLLLVGVPLMAASATLRFTESGELRLSPAMEQGATSVVSSTLKSIVRVAANFNPVPTVPQALPSEILVPSQTAFATRAFLAQYCVRCHSDSARVRGLSLETVDLVNLRAGADTWERVIVTLRSGMHTDFGDPKPDPAATRGVVAWLEDTLDRQPSTLGSPSSRPLNRTEYGNAIRDLLGLDIDAALLLPPDDSAYGFDNIASVLEAQRKQSADAWGGSAEKISRLAMSAPASRNRIFACRPITAAEEDSCASTILRTLATRAYRGKETERDVAELIEAYRSGRLPGPGSFDRGIEAALRRLLVNRKFLYRDESEPANLTTGQAYPLGDLDLASRLSFFLWSTSPDDRLLDLARQGRLNDPAVLESETRRMLQDPRAEALSGNFAGQWLNLRRLERVGPLPLFKDFDEALRLAMRREAELFFASIVAEDRNVLDLLQANYTFVNERLARHYGIPNIAGNEFRRVVLGPEFDNRRGLLGKAAILTVTSRPSRTSLVDRGNWVLRRIVGISPPDPPPNVPAIRDKIAGRSSDPTLRDLMAQHNFNEACRSCHSIMDPIGIALENFDAIGKWRTEDEGKRIDTTTRMVDGVSISGPADLRNALNTRSELFIRTLTGRLLTYALGRGVTYQDMTTVRSIAREAATDNNRFSAIVLGIVKSPVFQTNVRG